MASAVPKSVLDSGVSTPEVGVLGVRTICETCCSFFGPAVAFQGVGALAPTKNRRRAAPAFRGAVSASCRFRRVRAYSRALRRSLGKPAILRWHPNL